MCATPCSGNVLQISQHHENVPTVPGGAVSVWEEWKAQLGEKNSSLVLECFVWPFQDTCNAIGTCHAFFWSM